jgi:hypothetical protein
MVDELPGKIRQKAEKTRVMTDKGIEALVVMNVPVARFVE